MDMTYLCLHLFCAVGKGYALMGKQEGKEEGAYYTFSQCLCEISLYPENRELTEKLFQAATYFTFIPFSFQTFEHDQQFQKDFICTGTKVFSAVQL